MGEGSTPEEGQRRCGCCGRSFPATKEFFYEGKGGEGLSSYCRDCHRAAQRRRHRAVTMRVLAHYSGGTMRCACCGEARVPFLSIHHVNGGGRRHRQAIPSHDLRRWLVRQGFPPGYQVLCHNCHQAKHLYGECPHQTERRERSVYKRKSVEDKDFVVLAEGRRVVRVDVFTGKEGQVETIMEFEGGLVMKTLRVPKYGALVAYWVPQEEVALSSEGADG